jgi:hypothetical protein
MPVLNFDMGPQEQDKGAVAHDAEAALGDALRATMGDASSEVVDMQVAEPLRSDDSESQGGV